jgi:hypothetical protein
MKIPAMLSLTLSLSLPLGLYGLAFAQAGGDSLLGPAGYPPHRCTKPALPKLPVEVRTQAELLMHESQVRQYNQQAKIYTDCINAYLKVAGDDARRIQSRMDEAVAEANAR